MLAYEGERLPRCLSGKGFTCSAGDAGLIPASGRKGNPLKYSWLGNPSMDKEAWWPRVHGVSRELDTT